MPNVEDSNCIGSGDMLVCHYLEPMKTKPFSTSRRNFLKSTMTLPVALAAAPSLFTQTAGAQDAPKSAGALPRRQLGKDGPQVTMLCMGGMMAALSPDYIDIAWSMGIR